LKDEGGTKERKRNSRVRTSAFEKGVYSKKGRTVWYPYRRNPSRKGRKRGATRAGKILRIMGKKRGRGNLGKEGGERNRPSFGKRIPLSLAAPVRKKKGPPSRENQRQKNKRPSNRLGGGRGKGRLARF